MWYILAAVVLLLLLLIYKKWNEHFGNPYWGLDPNYPGQEPAASTDWGLPSRSPGGFELNEMYRDNPYWGLDPNYPGFPPYASTDWGIPGSSPGGMELI